MKKRIAGIVLCMIVFMTGLTGCGSDADKATYVQGLLDVAYNQGTEKYIEATDVSEEDAKKYTQQSLEAEAQVLAAYFGMEEPSKEVLKGLKELAEKMYKKASYEVKNSGDEVEVTVKPLMVMHSDAVKECIDQFNIRVYVDGDDTYTEESLVKDLTKCIENELKEAQYSEAETVKVKVASKDNKFSITDEELRKIDELILLY